MSEVSNCPSGQVWASMWWLCFASPRPSICFKHSDKCLIMQLSQPTTFPLINSHESPRKVCPQPFGAKFRQNFVGKCPTERADSVPNTDDDLCEAHIHAEPPPSIPPLLVGQASASSFCQYRTILLFNCIFDTELPFLFVSHPCWLGQ